MLKYLNAFTFVGLAEVSSISWSRTGELVVRTVWRLLDDWTLDIKYYDWYDTSAIWRRLCIFYMCAVWHICIARVCVQILHIHKPAVLLHRNVLNNILSQPYKLLLQYIELKKYTSIIKTLYCTFSIYTPPDDGLRGAWKYLGTSWIRKMC